MAKKELAEDLKWSDFAIPAETDTQKALRAVSGHIPKFKEGNTSALRRWLVEYRCALHNLNIKQEAGAKIMPFFLEGLAKTRFNQLSQEQTNSWDKLVESLIAAFEVPGDRELAQQEITTLKQGRLSIAEYARKLKTLGDYAYEGIPESVRDGLLVNHFMHHAANHIRRRLLRMDNPPKTLEEIIRRAEKFQRLHDLEELEKEDELIAAMTQLMRTREDRPPESNFRSSYRQPAAPPREENREHQQGRRDWKSNKPRYPPRGKGFPTQPPPRRYPSEYPKGRFPDTRPPGRFRDQRPPGPDNRQEGPREESYRNSRGEGSAAKRLLAYLTVAMMLVVPAWAGKPQICGFQQGGNLFVPPSILPCESPRTSIVSTRADLFELRTDPMRQIAHACYKQVFKVNTFSLFGIFSTATMTDSGSNGFQQVRTQECREAVRSKQYAGKDMTEGPKGVYRSASFGENIGNYTAWFGGKEVEHDEFIIVVGEVASFDGESTISTLGDTSKCSYPSGNCKMAEATVVWSESSPYRACKYQKMTSVDAFITDKHIAVPELKMFSTISQDMRFTQLESKGCLVGNVYFTDDGKMVSFPELPSDLWIPDYVRMKQDHHRRKRAAYLRLGGPNNTTIAISLGEKFATPLIYKYFKVDALEKIPQFETDPITHPDILADIKAFGVTNDLLMSRAKRYDQERKNSLGSQLIVLKCIRIRQYRYREFTRIHKLSGEKTEKDNQLLIAMGEDEVNAFDALLDLEFGKSEHNPGNFP
ncbi:hypothetical protein CRE_02722, partial [Caenorhabditis remanei]